MVFKLAVSVVATKATENPSGASTFSAGNSLAADVRRNTPGLSTVFVVDSPAVDVRRNFLFRQRDSTGVKLLLSESISVTVESSAESGSSTSVTAVAKKAPAGRAAVWSTASTGSCTGRVPAIPKHDAITVDTQYLKKLQKSGRAENTDVLYRHFFFFLFDCLQDRFGKYRQLAGAQYHISIRQIYEAENKLRLQSTLPTVSPDQHWECVRKQVEALLPSSNVVVTSQALTKMQDVVPVLVYVAGYAVYGTLKKLKCEQCRDSLTVDKKITVSATNEHYGLVKQLDRGGLVYPSMFALNAVAHSYVVVEQLATEPALLMMPEQRQVVTKMTLQLLASEEQSDFDTSVEKLLQESINVVTADKWLRARSHVQRIEEEFWQRDGIIDASLDRLEISLVSDRSSESDANDSEKGGMEEPL
ncbi:hypothetical protein HPB49_020291 [Dermacentor silvarum]|uniref:Uncharacterized protein n=1 Tax=Dermacentor silvarum TaxID=543639 RepID=A0ACB8CZQ6_DERSI|nr:hypothetical protein HPB49_020291 [Dermacentor silvarum]